MTATGVGRITATAGGGYDQQGKFVPESFPPDPFRLSTPVAAVAHYVGGSGEPRNYYFNRLDTSKLRISTFERVAALLREGVPGNYVLENDVGGFETNDHFGPHYTVGGITAVANGVLAIRKDGRYSFDGRLSAKPDKNNYDRRSGRTAAADRMTAIGRLLPGKPFDVYFIGSKPFSDTGHRLRR